MVYTALSALRKVKLFRGGLRRRDSLFIVLSTFLQRNSRSRPPYQSKFLQERSEPFWQVRGRGFFKKLPPRAFILSLQAALTALFEQIEEQIRRVALAGKGNHSRDDIGL